MAGRAILLLAFCSGALGVNYEVLYHRLLTGVFGAQMVVVATVQAVFLTGIALGAWAGRGRQRYLPHVEALIGACALASPWIAAALRQRGSAGESDFSIIAWISVLLIVPALAVGTSIPLFAGMLRARQAAEGDSFASSYSYYNLGAAFSLLVCEYLLLSALGQTATLTTLGLGNLLIAGLLWRPTRSLALPARFARPVTGGRKLLGVALASLGVAILQMLFFRICSEVLKPMRDVFALTLAVVLFGMWSGRGLARLGPLQLAAGVALSASAGFWLSLNQPGWLLFTYGQALQAVPDLGHPALFMLVRVTGALALGFVLFSCTGAILPACQRLLPGDPDGAFTMCASGLGNAAGYVLFVLLLHPALSEPVLAATACGAVLLGLGLVDPAPRQATLSLPLGVLATLSCLGTLAVPQWYAGQLPPGWHHSAALADPMQWRVVTAHERAQYAGVIQRRYPNRVVPQLSYMGQLSISADLRDTETFSETLSGLIPAVFAPRTDRLCVLGVGTGMTAGTAATQFARSDIVELNGAVLRLLPFFEDFNANLAGNTRSRLYQTDAAAFLLGQKESYDAILNSVSVPALSTAGRIYTLEFLRLAQTRLAPDGVYCTWVGLSTSQRAQASIMATVREAFPYIAITALRQGYFMLTCSRLPLKPRSFSTLQLEPKTRQNLASVLPGEDLSALDGLQVSQDFRQAIPPAPVNREDRPVVEFQSLDLRPFPDYTSEWLSKNPSFSWTDPVTGSVLSEEAFRARAPVYERLGLMPNPFPEEKTQDYERYLEEVLSAPAASVQQREELVNRTLMLLRRPDVGSDYGARLLSRLDGAPGFKQEASLIRLGIIAFDSRYRQFAHGRP